MNTKPLPQFDDIRINFELDLDENGGMLKFRTVKETKEWFIDEQTFWAPILNQNINNLPGDLDSFRGRFLKLTSRINQAFNEKSQRWNTIRKEAKEISNLLTSESKPDKEKEVENYRHETEEIIGKIKNSIASILNDEVLNNPNHLLRTTPAAQFVIQLIKDQPMVGFYALNQILSSRYKNSGGPTTEFTGRMLGTLYAQNLNRKIRYDKGAFQEAIKTWTKELKDYHADYDRLITDFTTQKAELEKEKSNWNNQTEEMREQFSQQLEEGKTNLKELEQTYRVHMTLAAPTQYWSDKKKEHEKEKNKYEGRILWTAIAGFFAMGVAAITLLPDFHPANEIPWRNIGLFMLLSTFLLWFIRMLIKLYLSHTHLYADASERVVMIQTFMALLGTEESREKLNETNIALVLAPLFKPSTTGVIKDDGGPITLSDFIGRISGK